VPAPAARRADPRTPPDRARHLLERGPRRTRDRRSQDNRRVLLLELLAWAIVRAESFATKEEFVAFEEELREARTAIWGARPWSGAKEQDRFLAH
jgi:hypothetical protein